MKTVSLLFVCAGNICRSPMAEGMARSVLEDRSPRQAGSLSLSSAGVIALQGNRPTPEAVEVMRRRGVDIGSHRAARLDEEVVSGCDLALVAESAQGKVVRALAGGEPPAVLLIGQLGEVARAARSGSICDREAMRERLEGLKQTAMEIERAGAWDKPEVLYEIEDPIGMDMDVYERVADSMLNGIEEFVLCLLAAP